MTVPSPLPKVLVIAPGFNVKGGITSVVRRYKENSLWNQYSCSCLETYDGANANRKIIAYIKALLIFPFAIIGKDIVHIHLSQIVSFSRKTSLFILSRLLRKKIIVHLHAPYPEEFRGEKFRRLAHYVFTRADVVIALSPAWADVITEISGRRDIRVINNPGIECDSDFSNRERTSTIVYIGKLEDRKGYADLLNAMVRVIKEVPDAKLVLAGNGDVEKARRLAESLHILVHVELLGWVDSKEISEQLIRAKVFCLPSYGEGVPMSMLEAMSSGVPVVVTPVGGIPDVIINEENGLLVEPGNIDSIASALIKVLSDEELAYSLASAAQKLIAEEYSSEKICKEIAATYDELMSRQ